MRSFNCVLRRIPGSSRCRNVPACHDDVVNVGQETMPNRLPAKPPESEEPKENQAPRFRFIVSSHMQRGEATMPANAVSHAGFVMSIPNEDIPNQRDGARFCPHIFRPAENSVRISDFGLLSVFGVSDFGFQGKISFIPFNQHLVEGVQLRLAAAHLALAAGSTNKCPAGDSAKVCDTPANILRLRAEPSRK